MGRKKNAAAGTPKNRYVLLFVLAFTLYPLPSSFLLASDNNVGTYGAVFLKIPTSSSRVQALGNCGVSLVEGAEAMGVNPAGIASSQMREVSFSYLSWLQDYGGQYLGYVHPVGQSVVGLSVEYYGTKNFDVRDQEGVPQYGTDVKVRNGYAALTLAKSFFLEKFLVGVSAKEVMEDNYVKKYQNLVFDAGAVIKLGRKFSLGWAGQNFSGKAKEVVKVQRLGLAYSFNSFLTAALEQKIYSDSGAKTGFGVEFNLPEEVLQVGRVSFRAGYTAADNHGKNMDDKTLDTLGMKDTSGWAFGIGIFSAQALGYGMGLDYTMVPYGALGKASQLALKFQF
ncbi:MAG: hypothetical protein A2X34_00895 [Elusimicrobia bacterium GWC2_51_8]|nr:MAG: hypothetical protein A2X33_00135 [Elusimicrobia bacterium GWA2_51_34]OGR57798.1 MAG: hypothetical protein A2X34_00895 [Elusimicrobia bacterium GWC2_51_8]OGR86951.1 MAG: hypothetical protein A2021_07605 [Elusimicrobia bacterium GWF2_52_66]HAF94436.1 hypothetical protein [Elusimicrobiota bacterium]HCE98933.1 hypothetical protein [Elusimicrobiota bacterium]